MNAMLPPYVRSHSLPRDEILSTFNQFSNRRYTGVQLMGFPLTLRNERQTRLGRAFALIVFLLVLLVNYTPPSRPPRSTKTTEQGRRSLNIAVAISGFFRECSATALSSLEVALIKPNLLKGNYVQIYAATWDIKGTRVPVSIVKDARYDGERFWTGQQMTYARERVSEEDVRSSIKTLTTATLASLSVVSYENVSQTWDLHVNRRKFPPGKTQHQVYGRHGMWTQVKYSIDAALRDSIADIIVRTRWDIVFKPNVRWIFQTTQLGTFQFKDKDGVLTDLQHESCNVSAAGHQAESVLTQHTKKINFTGHDTSMRPNFVFLPVRRDISDDMFAFGTRRAMVSYASIYNHIDELMDHLWNMPQPLQNEDILLLHMLKQQVCVMPFLQNHEKCT